MFVQNKFIAEKFTYAAVHSSRDPQLSVLPSQSDKHRHSLEHSGGGVVVVTIAFEEVVLTCEELLVVSWVKAVVLCTSAIVRAHVLAKRIEMSQLLKANAVFC